MEGLHKSVPVIRLPTESGKVDIVKRLVILQNLFNVQFLSVFIFLTEITFCFIAEEIFIELCVEIVRGLEV